MLEWVAALSTATLSIQLERLAYVLEGQRHGVGIAGCIGGSKRDGVRTGTRELNVDGGRIARRNERDGVIRAPLIGQRSGPSAAAAGIEKERACGDLINRARLAEAPVGKFNRRR